MRINPLEEIQNFLQIIKLIFHSTEWQLEFTKVDYQLF